MIRIRVVACGSVAAVLAVWTPGCAIVVDTADARTSTSASGGSSTSGGAATSGSSPASGSAGAPASSTDSGLGGGLLTGGAGGAPCARLEGGADVVEGNGEVPVQAYCDPSQTNPPECPPSKPQWGTPCPTEGLRCAYGTGGAAFEMLTCKQEWASVVHTCHQTCDPPAPEDMMDGAAACGSLPDIPCDQNPNLTDQALANNLLREVAECCTPPSESSLTVTLEDGCAVASHLDSVGPEPGFTDCMRSLLQGRRFDCAAALTCVTAEWSTIAP